jgi:hypothetical protein
VWRAARSISADGGVVAEGRLFIGQEREGSPGELDGFRRIPPEAGEPRPHGRGEPQQNPAVLTVAFASLLGFFQEGFGVVRPAGDH